MMSVKRGGSAGCPAGEGESVTAAEKVTAELVLEEGGASRWMDMGKMADESAAKAWGGVPDTLARTVELACLKCSICRVRMAVEETRRVGWLVSRRSVCLARRWELCCFVCA